MPYLTTRERSAMQKGMQQGMQEGMLLGAEKEKVAIAKGLLMKGIEIQTAADVTGLSIAQLDAIKNSILH